MPTPEELAAAATWVEEHTDAATTGLRFLPLWFNLPRVGLDAWTFETTPSLDHCDAAAWETLVVGVPRREVRRHPHEQALLNDPTVVHESPRWTLLHGQPLHAGALLWDGWHQFRDVDLKRVRPDGSERTCQRWIHGGLHCGTFHEWVYAAAGWRRMDRAYEACITATLPGHGEAWQLRWEDVPMAPELRLRAGNVVFAARSQRGSAIDVVVFIDDHEVFQQTIEPQDPTYHDLRIPTGKALGEEATVTLQLRTEDGLDRFFCVRPQICTLSEEEAMPSGSTAR